MRFSAAGMLFALAGLAVAAPVPKTAPKLEDVFGEVADKKSECKFEMKKDGALTVTVPTTHPALEPSNTSTAPPLVGKTVTGDFEVTVRVALDLPKTAEGKGATLLPAVMAGLSIVSADTPKVGTVIGTVRRLQRGEWGVTNFFTSWEPWQGGVGPAISKAEVAAEEKSGNPTWLRVTRRGWRVDVETSGDGTTWAEFNVIKMRRLGDAVSVGPVAFGCIDQEFSVTFDQYELKALKDEKK